MFLTQSYKGYFIHTRLDEPSCGPDEIRVQKPDYDTLGTYSSVRGAKSAISRHIEFMRQYEHALKTGPAIVAAMHCK